MTKAERDKRYREKNLDKILAKDREKRQKLKEETGYTHDVVYQTEYRNRNRGELNRGFKRHRRVNLAKRLVTAAKTRAKKRGLDFSIDHTMIEIPTVCPVLGIEMFVGDDKAHYGSPTLDRFDNSKGYVEDNVRVISRRANTLKSDASLEEMEKIVEYMKSG